MSPSSPGLSYPPGRRWSVVAFFVALHALVAADAGRAQLITEFSLPPGSWAQNIAAGPDGNLWFTEPEIHKIGRITTEGAIREFDIPQDQLLYSITAGPDGNVWFTAETSPPSYVGRITPAGVVTEFEVPTHGANMGGITTGPDGNLWFTEAFANKIGRLTPSGHFTEFPVPACTYSFGGLCYLKEIVVGPDGDLWVSDPWMDRLWRITTSGVVTDFSAPGTPPPLPDVVAKLPFVGLTNGGITAGPDGNVWSTPLVGEVGLSNSYRIRRTTPTGVVTDFPLGVEDRQAGGITAGSDGNLWFTLSKDNVAWIGRLNLHVPSGPCVVDATSLCLNGNRFRVQAAWSVPIQGTSGAGKAVPLTEDTGYFWFFNNNNVELVLKVLDGTALNGHFWVFYGALSNVQYTITVTDTQTGTVTPYANPAGTLASIADTSAFRSQTGAPEYAPANFFEAVEASHPLSGQLAAATGCTPDRSVLCLNQSRFQVTVDWAVPHQGSSGQGTATPLTGDTGYFWFFNNNNVELVLKVLDGAALNGHFWVFYGALSDVQYTITVTDTQTQAVQTYTNPSGTLASVADTAAF